MLRSVIKLALKITGGLALVWVAALMIKHTMGQGNDFAVFRMAAERFLLGESIYNLEHDGGMVFKYPPWTVAPLAFLALMPDLWARWFWGVLQVASLWSMVEWVRRYTRSEASVGLTVAAFTGIWIVHGLNGQINLLIGAVVLWGWEWRHRRPVWTIPLITGALSLKIFSCVALLGLSLKKKDAWQIGAVTILLAVLLSIPVVGGLGEWIRAAASGGEHLAGALVRGRDNQGLPALALRVLSVPAENTHADLIAFAVLAPLLVLLWKKCSREMTEAEVFSGYLALAAILHPLAWFHLFVWVFPLACFALDRAVRTDSFGMKAIAILGLCLIGLVTSKTLGSLGLALEMLSVKSWGVLILAGLMAHLSGQRRIDVGQ